VTSVRYVGDWKMNKKSGFGIQVYPNGDKYEVTIPNNDFIISPGRLEK